MPKDLRGMPDQEFPGYSGVISNWFWRDNEFNRQDDNLAIKLIQEARALKKSKEEASKRRATWFALVIPPNMMKGFSVARSLDVKWTSGSVLPITQIGWRSGKKGD